MKKIICFALALLCAISFSACAKKNEDDKQELREDIPKAYVGDIDVEQNIKIADLNIVIKDSIFYVNDILFKFSEFEKTNKLSTQLGDGMLDVYVEDNTLQKCVVYAGDNTSVTTYNIDGKSSSCQKCLFDEYGNKVYEAEYDGEGALQSFYTATYENMKISEKREYNPKMELTAVVKYEYDGDGNLLKEIVYDAELQLKEVKEN